MALPVEITPRIMQALDLISQGQSPTKACDTAKVSVATLNKYVRNDPFLSEVAQEAYQNGHDRMADALLHITDEYSEYGSKIPAEQSINSANIKWYLSKKNPTMYGEKMTIENKYTVDKVIIDRLAKGRERALTGEVNQVIEDAVFEVVDEAFDISKFM